MTFKNPDDYDRVDKFDKVTLKNVKDSIVNNKDIILVNETKNEEYPMDSNFSERQKDMLLAGGLLNFTSGNK